MENNIPNRFYRTSAKALILNEARDKFLIVQERGGVWDLPGGGLDWGETTHESLSRKIPLEMSVPIAWISASPAYFLTQQSEKNNAWFANVLYEVELEHLNFTPSDDCVACEFVSKNDLGDRHLFPNVRLLAEMFDPMNHVR